MDAATEAERELKLQHELQRFVTEFTERISQLGEQLGRAREREVRDAALRQCLRYVAGAMEIATGPATLANLLDLVVFVRLCRSALERHWIPQVFGDAGRGLEEVWRWASERVDVLERRALSVENQAALDRVVSAWLEENPGQVRVEGVRLADFAEAAGSAAADRVRQSKGLLSSVSSAKEAAHQALLWTERAVFLVHRLPFLWRLQGRLAAREVMGDTVALIRAEFAPTLRRWGQILGWLGLVGGSGWALRRVWKLARG